MLLKSLYNNILNRFNYFLKITLFLNLVSLGVFASYGYSHGKAPVKFKDVKGWQKLGPTFLGGLDADGNLMAVYDLTFPSLLDRVRLGVLDLRKNNLDNVTRRLRDVKNYGNLSRVDEKKVNESLATLEKFMTGPAQKNLLETGTVLPAGWWKSIPWKHSVMGLSNEAPKRFFLSDLNVPVIATDFKLFQSQLKKIGEGDLLNQIEFVKSNIGYQIYFTPQNTLAMMDSDVISEPRKIVDLHCPNCGIITSVGYDALRVTLKSMMSLIPVPIVAGLATAGINEYFSFKRELMQAHIVMALELIREAEKNENADSPFRSLTDQQRKDVTHYLLLAQSSLESSVNWIITTPEADWIKQGSKDLAQAHDSENYLSQRGTKLELLNPRFAFGMAPNGHNKIYSLAAFRYWNLLSPFVAIDYSHPYRNFYERIAIETGYILINFLSPFSPYPGVGSAVAEVYKVLLEDRMHDVQRWESRLTAHLSVRASLGETWKDELDILAVQTINPFEISPEQGLELANERRKAYNLP